MPRLRLISGMSIFIYYRWGLQLDKMDDEVETDD